MMRCLDLPLRARVFVLRVRRHLHSVDVCTEVEVGRVPGFVITKSLIHATN